MHCGVRQKTYGVADAALYGSQHLQRVAREVQLAFKAATCSRAFTERGSRGLVGSGTNITSMFLAGT